jgi:hypothetical protein
MKTTVSFFIFVIAAVTLRGQPVADSVADFSGTQGRNNWYYGYYNVSADVTPGYNPTNDFAQLPQFAVDFWRISGSFWTEIHADWMHPNSSGDNVGRTPQEHWAIRRWVSEITGLVRIHGRLAKVDGAGDGVVWKVFVNGRSVFERFIEGTDTAGTNYSFGVGIKEGDLIDFALDDAGTPGADSTYFTAVIERADFALTTAPAVEVGIPTEHDKRYQVEHSVDLETWTPVGDPFTGTGEATFLLFSIRELGSPGFFRAMILP